MRIHFKAIFIFTIAMVALFAVTLGLSKVLILDRLYEFNPAGSAPDQLALRELGDRTIRFFLVALAVSAGALFLLVWFGLDRAILSPVRSLCERVNKARLAGRLPLDLGLERDDEIGRLAEEIEGLARSVSAVERRYEAIVESQTDLICRYRPSGMITFANRAFCEFVGGARESIVGANLFVILSSEQDVLSERIAAISEWEPEFRLEGREVDASGAERWLQRIDRGAFDAVGKITEIQSVMRDVTARKQAEQALRRLSGRLLSLQDQERRRMARDLHDSTGQNLTALQINLSMLADSLKEPNAQAERLLADTRDLADQCCTEIRTISYLLHPPLLDEAGLLFALKWLVDGFAKRAGKAITIDISTAIPRLPAELETCMFRVAQEALNNVHRHSSGRSASVSIERTEAALVLEVRDDGAGIAPDRLAALNQNNSLLGVGLIGMRERLAQLGGKLEIQSDSRETLVRAVVHVNWKNLCPN